MPPVLAAAHLRSPAPLPLVRHRPALPAALCRPPQVSTLLNQTYLERRVRVYCKQRNDRMIAAVRQAFDTWSKRTFGSHVEMATPCKTGKKRARPDGTGLETIPDADEVHS